MAADAGRSHQHERPPLAGLRVVERHLLVRRRLAAPAAAAAQLQRRAVPLALVGLPRAQQRGRAGLPRARRHLLLLQRLVTSLLSKYLIVQKIFDNALKIFAHLVPLLPLQRHAVLLQGEAGHEAGEGLGPLAVPVGLPPVLVLPVDDVQDVAPLERDAELVARDVQVVVGVVVEVRAEMQLEGEKTALDVKKNGEQNFNLRHL